MVTTLLLSWFPIILAVAVGARLLGRARGLGWAALCALFWVALVSAIKSSTLLMEPGALVALVAGVVSIMAMGAWAGDMPVGSPQQDGGRAANPDAANAESASLDRLLAMMEQFDQWLEELVPEDDPWSQFDEFIRSALFHSCTATHVRPYRLDISAQELVPLSASHEDWETQRLPVGEGVAGHVATSGCSYVAGDEQRGELVDGLANAGGGSIAWCFPVREKGATIGVVTVGELRETAASGRRYLQAVEQLVQQFWHALSDRYGLWNASRNDSVAGILSKHAFLESAAISVRESYAMGEPVSVAVFALEGMRSLNDSGRWDLADELARDVGATLRRKVRADDRIGRFDGSRFILLLRRVDSELATLIVQQLMNRLTRICEDKDRWGVPVKARCGLAGSGTDQVELTRLVADALTASRKARLEDEAVATDVPTAVGAESHEG